MSAAELPPAERRRREAAVGKPKTAAPARKPRPAPVQSAAQFVVEYACPAHCRIEIDLDNIGRQVTHRQMRALTDGEHALRHTPAGAPAPLSSAFKRPAPGGPAVPVFSATVNREEPHR